MGRLLLVGVAVLLGGCAGMMAEKEPLSAGAALKDKDANVRVAVMENKALELLSEPGEDAEQFRQRCRAAAEKRAAAEAQAVVEKYKPKFEKLKAEQPALPTPPAGEAQSSWLGRLVPWLSGRGWHMALAGSNTQVA